MMSCYTNEVVWLRVGTSGGICDHGNEPSEKAEKESAPRSELVSLSREMEL
jgi:hypothetical protein